MGTAEIVGIVLLVNAIMALFVIVYYSYIINAKRRELENSILKAIDTLDRRISFLEGFTGHWLGQTKGNK